MTEKEQPKRPTYAESEEARKLEAKKNKIMNNALRNPRPGSRVTVTVPNKTTPAGDFMNKFIRSEKVETPTFTEAELEKQAQDKLDKVKTKQTARAAAGNAGAGTGTSTKMKKKKGFNQNLRDIMAERKRLGL